MSTAIVVIVVVLALLAGLIFSLRNSARNGMPSKDVLERATERSRQLDANERAERGPAERGP